uniref:Uncharacterized protein n=1 Tax=Arundo donax TaxID=35708 RepID=A0A0A9GU85_ARUDO
MHQNQEQNDSRIFQTKGALRWAMQALVAQAHQNPQQKGSETPAGYWRRRRGPRRRWAGLRTPLCTRPSPPRGSRARQPLSPRRRPLPSPPRPRGAQSGPPSTRRRRWKMEVAARWHGGGGLRCARRSGPRRRLWRSRCARRGCWRGGLGSCLSRRDPSSCR